MYDHFNTNNKQITKVTALVPVLVCKLLISKALSINGKDNRNC